MTARTWRRDRRSVTFTDGLPVYWSALVRRNRWGTWSVEGAYAGPGTPGPVKVIWGWCWSEASAMEQVRYWVEEAADDFEEASDEWNSEVPR